MSYQVVLGTAQGWKNDAEASRQTVYACLFIGRNRQGFSVTSECTFFLHLSAGHMQKMALLVY